MDYVKQQYRYRVSKFRVKIKSLAVEAKIIRFEESRSSGWACAYLRSHRINEVRSEQRHTLLAYAFLRGRAYSSVEQSCVTEPIVSRIERILKSLGGGSGVGDVQSWLSVRSQADAA